MSEDQYTKLFQYIKDFRGGVDRQLSKQDTKIDQIYNLLDRDAKNIEVVSQENAVRDRQQERMERWIQQLAEKTGSSLKYDS